MRFLLWMYLPVIVVAARQCWQQAHEDDFPKSYLTLAVFWAIGFFVVLASPFTFMNIP